METGQQPADAAMARERLKSRLRQHLGASPPGTGPDAGPVSVVADAPPPSLEQLVSGHPQAAGPGVAYVVATAVAGLAGGVDLERRYRAALTDPEAAFQQRLRAAGYSGPLAPEACAFLDVETAGLGNVPVFLVGLLVWQADGLQVVQFLARDYAEEAAALALWQAECQGRGVLVTFNGKSFDVPCLRTRATLHRLTCAWEPHHVDLLHEARRVWGSVLPNCRLQTLEQFVCRRFRGDDIPGAQIPEVYHHFVRTGDARLLARVLTHNAWDLVTLADLLLRMPPPG